jgi:signal transduction histidine kinase
VQTAEVAVVGWLGGRRKVGLVLADALYWLVLGLPLVYVFYHLLMEVPPSHTYIVMVKQAVNGISNALIARLIFTSASLRWRAALISYSDIINDLLAAFVLFPALLTLAIGSRADFAEADQRLRTELLHDSSRVKARLESWLANRESTMAELAELAASTPPAQMGPALRQATRADGNLLRVGLLDENAITTAYQPAVDELGGSNLGKDFSDRPFLPTLRRTLAPMLSEVVLGRIGAPAPIVTLLAPVVKAGRWAGYLAGTISLERLRGNVERSLGTSGQLCTLLDRHGNIILTTRTDQKVMTPFMRAEGTLERQPDGTSRWVAALHANKPVSERWKSSFYVTEDTIGRLAEWTVVLEQPVAPVQKALYDAYTRNLFVVFVILLVALALAASLGRVVVDTLEKLGALTRQLPLELEAGHAIAWPETSVREAHDLVGNFQEMASLLSRKFAEIREMNASLEHRVEGRTAELETLNHTLEERIARSLAELRTKDQLLIAQSRRAAMGEMIGNIAHQWRQPLNTLALLLANLRDASRFGELDAAEVEKAVTDCNLLIHKMSDTINDFRDFFRPDKERRAFSARAQIEEAVALVGAALGNAGIRLSLDLRDDLRLFGYPNEYSQVLLNLLTNAAQAIRGARVEAGAIRIEARVQGGDGRVAVTDNGGGFSEAVQARLFEPYFSTKEGGTGIGLYMSQQIVERGMGGRVEARNVEGGAEFVVSVPLAVDTAPLRLDTPGR